jgi:plasmid stabilization system protein ParE
MAKTIQITHRAERSLTEIVTYLSEEVSENAAECFLKTVRQKSDWIAQNPDSG